MLIKLLAVVLVGIIGGLTHRMLFEKKFYLPKFKQDKFGRYLDLGLLEDVFVGIVAALAVALPIIEHVPLLNLVGSSILPAIAGKTFLNTAIKQYIEQKKTDLQAELERLEKGENQITKEKEHKK